MIRYENIYIIRADEPSDLGIVVPAADIVQACLLVPVVAAVAEGVALADRAGQASSGADGLAPGVIPVLYYQCSGIVNDAGDVVLGITDVVVSVAARRHADQLPGGIVGKIRDRAAGLLRHQEASRHAELRHHAAHRFFDTGAGVVIGISRGGAALHCGRKASSPYPGVGGASLLQHVPGCIIGDSLSFLGQEPVLPSCRRISGGDGLCGRAAHRRGCRIGVLLLGCHVAAQVIGVHDGLALHGVVLAYQLVPLVVEVPPGAAAVRDGRDVPVGIVGVALPGVPEPMSWGIWYTNWKPPAGMGNGRLSSNPSRSL